MNDNTFQKVGKTEKRMFGPPCIIICGYRVDEQETILSLIETCGLSRHPVLFATEEDADMILRDIVTAESGKGGGSLQDSQGRSLLSGLTEKDCIRSCPPTEKEIYAAALGDPDPGFRRMDSQGTE